jgi:hypothetical protein
MWYGIILSAMVEQTLRIIQTLSPREESILRKRFGIGVDKHTLEEAGDEHGISKSRVLQIQTASLRKLRNPGVLQSLLEPAQRIPERQEREPKAGVLDLLERRAQFKESELFRRWIKTGDGRKKEHKALNKEYHEAWDRLADELATLYDSGNTLERRTIEYYSSLNNTPTFRGMHWHSDLSSPRAIRTFIALVEPMSEQELLEEIRKAEEALEKKALTVQKIKETKRRNSGPSLSEILFRRG